MTGTHWKADGTFKLVAPEDGSHFGLKELQGFVGGSIEIVAFPDGTVLVCNEEGKLKNLPINENATAIWCSNFGIDTDTIVGDVLVCMREMIE